MSVTRRAVAIDCDGPAAGGGCPTFNFVVRRGTAAYIREDLQAQGWQTGLPGGKDRCPNCCDQESSSTETSSSGGGS